MENKNIYFEGRLASYRYLNMDEVIECALDLFNKLKKNINEMNNILITGGAGYIGSHIVEQLIKAKKVFVVDNLSTGYKRLIHKKANFFLCDIRNFKRLNKIVKQNKIQSIIHLAACLSVGESEKNQKIFFKQCHWN